jgi:hypothetical protein
LHILSISVFVEFVCLLVQLLLVACVSSLFHRTLAVTPTVTPPPLGFPSLSRGAVGQKKEKKRKKGKQSNYQLLCNICIVSICAFLEFCIAFVS